MSRVKALDRDAFDPELRARTDSLDEVELGHLRILAHSPKAALAFISFIGGVNDASRLPRRLVELVRLRIAFHNQCPHCMAIRFQDAVQEGLSETLVCSLEKPEEAPDLDDRERAALEYADMVATNHFAVSGTTFDRLREHFSEREIVELGVYVAIFVGFGRVTAGWAFTDDLPERYRHTTPGGLTLSDDALLMPVNLATAAAPLA
jgi:AhpD family alkylhydroperoxidase